MNRPRVSVLIPTYNYARYLPEAIDSVLAQDFQDYELLIADDSSTDGSAEVLARYTARDPRIRQHVHPVNVGMVKNWNWCLAQARGEYIKFLFADDKLAHPQALRRFVELLEANPTAVLVASARQVIDESSTLVETWNDFQTPGLHQGDRTIAHCLLANRNLIGEPSVAMFRHRDSRPGFDIAYRQLVDLEMWFRLLENGGFVYTAEVLSCFRRHASQQSEINRVDQVAVVEMARLTWKYLERCPLKPLEKRNVAFKMAHGLRQLCRRNPEALQLRQNYANLLGKLEYVLCWCRYRLARLGKDLQKLAPKGSQTQ